MQIVLIAYLLHMRMPRNNDAVDATTGIDGFVWNRLCHSTRRQMRLSRMVNQRIPWPSHTPEHHDVLIIVVMQHIFNK